MDELFSVEGKVALVTGGSGGIGKMIAEGFVRAGATVYLAARRAEPLDRVVAELSQHGRCAAITADLSTEEGCIALASRFATLEGRLDILVNNAGATCIAPLDEYPASGWDDVFDVNVRGLFLLTRELLPSLRAAATRDVPARVINIGSIGGLMAPTTEWYAYSASKAAVHHLTRHLGKRLAGDHITVNAIAPGTFESEMTASIFGELEERAVDVFPLQRTGRPEDMAGTAIFLASLAGSYITGAVIPVEGGISTLR